MINTSNTKNLIVPVFALFLALLVSALIMLICGYNPITAYGVIFKGALGSKTGISNSLVQATPLIFTGLAFMVAKKATLINLGVEGQLYVGALVGALVGTIDFHVPFIIHILLVMISGMLAGGLAGLFIGWLKVRFGSNEVITTMMTNFIIINFTSYLVTYPLKAEGPTAQTERMLPTALLPKLFEKTQLTWGIIIVIMIAICIKVFIDKTKMGYEIKAVGQNKRAAQTAGIKVSRVVLFSMFLSGAIAGLGGTVQVMSVNRRFVAGFSADYGFGGISVAALANDSPIGIIVSGFIFGLLRNGANFLNMTSRIPTEFVSVVQALVVLFVAAPLMIEQILNIFKKKKEIK
jgi:simple sugar transport system permease protein